MYGRISGNLEAFRTLIAQSFSYAELIRKLGYKEAGGTYKYVQGKIKQYGIDTSHFTGSLWSKGSNSFIDNRLRREKKPSDQVFKKDNFCQENITVIKRLVIEFGVKYECSVCGIRKWNDKPLRLRLDHVNGDHFDYRVENLRLICPNCDSQTDTCSRGLRKKVNKNWWWHFLSTGESQKVKKVLPKIQKENKTKICGCGNKITERSKHGICMKCWKLKSRKVHRPSYEQLLKDVSEMSYLAVGKKYGVSDNAVRKWIRYYKKDSFVSTMK